MSACSTNGYGNPDLDCSRTKSKCLIDAGINAQFCASKKADSVAKSGLITGSCPSGQALAANNTLPTCSLSTC